MEVVINGDAVDGSGRVIGQLHAIAVSATSAIEALLDDLGIEVR